MKKRFNAEEVWNVLIEVIAFLSAIVGIVTSFKSWDGYSRIIMVMGILIFALFYEGILNHQRMERWEGAALLARRGHLQTIRMILLRDYLKRHRDEEEQGEIKVKNDFTAEKARFNFIIGERKGGASDIKYKHLLDVKRRFKKRVGVYPWIFGDDDAEPTNCKITIDEKEFLVPSHRMNVSFSDYPVNDGIYAINGGTIDLDGGRSKEIGISYVRENAYKWDRQEVFVIYPQCFAWKCKKADFKVIYEDMPECEVSVCVTEVVCTMGAAKLKNARLLLRETTEDGKMYYCLKNIKIDADNVYILEISHMNAINP